jgi:hypothetical protein
MNVEIGTETPKFLFWEYLFQNFGILSLQCGTAALLTQGEVEPAMSGEGTREEADPQLTCLLMEAPRGQQDPPHGEADRAYKTASLSE